MRTLAETPAAVSAAPPDTRLDATRSVYDAMASLYPLITFLYHSKAHACALRRSGIRNGMSVLEVAMGNGGMARQLLAANPNGRVIGIDLSPKMAACTLRRARRDFPDVNASYGAADACSLPFQSASFDAVMCSYLFELQSRADMSRALNEMARVMRPGATLSMVLVGQNLPFFNGLYGLGRTLTPGYFGRQVEREVPGIVEGCGMHLIKDEFVRQLFYPSRVLVAQKP